MSAGDLGLDFFSAASSLPVPTPAAPQVSLATFHQSSPLFRDPLFPFVSPTSILHPPPGVGTKPEAFWVIGTDTSQADTTTLFTEGRVKTEQLPPLWLSAALTASFQTCNLSQDLRFTTYFPLRESPPYNTLAYPASCGRRSQQKLISLLIFHR